MKLLTHLAVCLCAAWGVAAQQRFKFNGPANGDYLLANNGTAPTVWVDSKDATAVQRAAEDLALDFGRVSGTNGTVTSDLSGTQGPVIIVGTIGKSSIIDQLISNAKFDVSAISGKWESYIAQVVDAPTSGVSSALVIAGSDRRGTIFGMYDVSESIGVSPLYWWADVPPTNRNNIWVIRDRKTQGEPTVKWRGIFINNESPSLTTWAAKKYPKGPYGSNLGDEFYAHVFELILRLKGNYMWPAMWGKMFYLDTSNDGKISDDYGIVIGTSHHEPMARSEAEQNRFCQGPWDWETNEANVRQFMREGVQRGSKYETLYTVGMRGSGDAANPALTPAIMEQIVNAQQEMFSDILNTTDLSTVPQAWVLYTEVGKYYQAGMKVPDSVTLLWTDDNYGNLLRTPLSNETDHGAGHGVYFHFDFNGGIRCYKWINSIQIMRTWEQMHLAYEKGAREIWITNIGDVKPLEIPTMHFMDMAYDFTKHTTPDSVSNWIARWATQQFGSAVAQDTVDILTKYGILISRQRYEMLSFSPFVWSTSNYDEAASILQEWVDLLALAQKAHDRLNAGLKIPFYEMVLHPVLAGKTVVELYITWAFNQQYAGQKRVSTNNAAAKVRELFALDQQITDEYHGLLNHKWDGMVIQPHIGYTTWSDPPNNIMPNVTYYSDADAGSNSIFAAALEGGRTFSPGTTINSMYSMDNYMPDKTKRWIEVFARQNGTFTYTISSNASYVTVSDKTSNISTQGGITQKRHVVSVDWALAPVGTTTVGIDVTRNGGSTEQIRFSLVLRKRSTPVGFSGFVESGGVIAMEVDHYSSAESKNGVSYQLLPAYGRTKAGLKIWPVTADTQTPANGPKVTYSFNTLSSSSSANITFYFGTAINHDPSRKLAYAFSIDNGTPKTVLYVPNHAMGSLPTGWRDAVVTGAWSSKQTVQLSQGAHTLNLWLLEPGVVAQRIIVDMGGLRASQLGPPESVWVNG